MKKEIPAELLQRYLRGECTPEESTLVDAWYSSFDEENSDDERLLKAGESEQLRRIMLTRIKNSLPPYEVPHEDTVVKSKHVRLINSYYRAAAIILLLAIAGLGVLYLPKFYQPNAALQTATLKVRNTTRAITRQVLGDGTVVWLKPQSSIEYPKVFAEESRDLKLIGEAFFDVAKEKNRPFTITTGDVLTKVLGTSFNIKAYEASSIIEISVMTGKVAVQMKQMDSIAKHDSATVLLTPNERVTYVKSENRLKKEIPAQLPELDIWQVTTIVYDNVAVEKVLQMLEQKFSVHIQVRNPNLLNCLIRADFTNQNLADILEMLARSIEATYELKDNTIYLDGVGCVE